jgi:glucokinase
VELWRFLAAQLDHVSHERVCSGMGIVNIERFLRTRRGTPRPTLLEAEMVERDAGVAISRAALEGRDDVCSHALDLFVSIFGSAAGNLALRMMALAVPTLGRHPVEDPAPAPGRPLPWKRARRALP